MAAFRPTFRPPKSRLHQEQVPTIKGAAEFSACLQKYVGVRVQADKSADRLRRLIGFYQREAMREGKLDTFYVPEELIHLEGSLDSTTIQLVLDEMTQKGFKNGYHYHNVLNDGRLGTYSFWPAPGLTVPGKTAPAADADDTDSSCE